MASSKKRAARGATEALKILWEDGFFTAAKKKPAIDTELASRGNHFTTAELGMALMRAKQLTRRGKRGDYEYIQKYPIEVEESAKAQSKPARKK
jgi:predicted deacylase